MKKTYTSPVLSDCGNAVTQTLAVNVNTIDDGGTGDLRKLF
jgi:hypothetical protein